MIGAKTTAEYCVCWFQNIKYVHNGGTEEVGMTHKLKNI